MNAVPAVRATAAAVMRDIGAADYGVGGRAPAIYDISSISNSDLLHVIPIAIVVIGILLALVMRSLVAPLYLIVSVLGGTFSVFAIVGAQQGSSQFRDIGAGLALGVLMDTFFVRTLLVPSTVILLGRWNWWPSKLGTGPEVEDIPAPESPVTR